MQEVNESDFENEVLKSSKLTVVDFTASWCGPCKMMSPVFEALSKEMTNVKFLKLDVDENQEIASKYNVLGVPTFLVFNKGKEVARIVGGISKDQLKSKIQSAL